MKIFQNKVIAIFLLTLVSITNIYAQADEDPGFGDGSGGDPGAAPINDYLPLLVILAIAFAYYKIRKVKMNNI